MHMYMKMSGRYVCVTDMSEPRGARITGGCELCNLGTENQEVLLLRDKMLI